MVNNWLMVSRLKNVCSRCKISIACLHCIGTDIRVHFLVGRREYLKIVLRIKNGTKCETSYRRFEIANHKILYQRFGIATWPNKYTYNCNYIHQKCTKPLLMSILLTHRIKHQIASQISCIVPNPCERMAS